MLRHKPTAQDVAERAGVSRSLVSMYLRKNPNLWISRETRERLDAAIRELGYRPNQTAQTLRSGKSHIVGVVLGGISGSFASCLCEALMEKLDDAGYRVFLGITKYDPARERRILESMMNFDIDALFYTLEPDYVRDLLLQCAASIPVFVGEKRPGTPFHSIEFDLRTAFSDALDFLAGLGVRRAALLTNAIGYGERDFFAAASEKPLLQIRSFRIGTPCGKADGREEEKLREELRLFQPGAVLSSAGVRVRSCGNPGDSEQEPFWIDSWTLPFQREEIPEGFRPGGSIVRPFREFAEMLADALLEALRNSGEVPRSRCVTACFRNDREQKELRKVLMQDPYFQTFEH